jgi:ribosomal protein S27E
MTRMNWGRQKSQARMQRYGSESVRGEAIPPIGRRAPLRRPTWKADLRTETTAAAAIAPVRTAVSVTCPNPNCGHTATVAVFARPGLRFKCSACGSTTLAGSTP